MNVNRSGFETKPASGCSTSTAMSIWLNSGNLHAAIETNRPHEKNPEPRARIPEQCGDKINKGGGRSEGGRRQEQQRVVAQKMFRNEMRRDHSEVNSRGGGGKPGQANDFSLTHRPRESYEVGGKEDLLGFFLILSTLKKSDDKSRAADENTRSMWRQNKQRVGMGGSEQQRVVAQKMFRNEQSWALGWEEAGKPRFKRVFLLHAAHENGFVAATKYIPDKHKDSAYQRTLPSDTLLGREANDRHRLTDVPSESDSSRIERA
ncbi:hypothetical protein CEXT_561581 [Caerostris extrusa]|uniref:Uncharacterized protein n=1 Tax=Caerostris extrusa TaxID=172846 RepID=A0AAV4WMB0_CAEEX|nr:hypothetical protein CEXT_561581 [Caerostris extrusa]